MKFLFYVIWLKSEMILSVRGSRCCRISSNIIVANIFPGTDKIRSTDIKLPYVAIMANIMKLVVNNYHEILESTRG